MTADPDDETGCFEWAMLVLLVLFFFILFREIP